MSLDVWDDLDESTLYDERPVVDEVEDGGLVPFGTALADAMLGLVEVFKNGGRDRDPVLSRLPYPEYLRSPHWQRVRQRKLAIAGYQCHRCWTTDDRLDVHHLTYDRLGREADDDLEILCALCHAKEHAA